MATKKSTQAVKKQPASQSKTKTSKNPPKTVVKNSEYKSFQLDSEKDPFITFRITRQTLYWLILGLLAVIFASYTLSVTQSIEDIYSQIDDIRTSDASLMVEKPEAKKQP